MEQKQHICANEPEPSSSKTRPDRRQEVGYLAVRKEKQILRAGYPERSEESALGWGFAALCHGSGFSEFGVEAAYAAMWRPSRRGSPLQTPN